MFVILLLTVVLFRDLDKERMKLERQEKQIINDIKKMAKQGEMAAVKVMAKDLVRTRRYVKKFIMMKANIQAVSLKITTLKSQGAMANAMKGVTKAMGAMNKQINMPQMQKIMMEFEKEVSVRGSLANVDIFWKYFEISAMTFYSSLAVVNCRHISGRYDGHERRHNE